jgi:antirestriction protein ArdC
MARFLPPDHSKGDEHTLGGYMAVHARPAAFEGSDGASYSADIATDETGDAGAPVGGYLIFVRWGQGEPRITGHLESAFLARGRTEAEVKAEVGAMALAEAKRILDELIRAEGAETGERKWWDVMRDENESRG